MVGLWGDFGIKTSFENFDGGSLGNRMRSMKMVEIDGFES